MSLRVQDTGRGKAWTLDELKAGFEEFYKEHDRYPLVTEVDTYQYLPSSRSIQRQYGGLVTLRKTLGLSGQNDYRSGVHSSNRAFAINKRANTTENKVYAFLCERFGKEYVHREYFFTDDARTRADFFIYDQDGNFCVDVFYPANKKNLIGCINSKLQKYSAERMKDYPVIFLQMNPDISQSEIDLLIERKHKPLLKNQALLEWEAFERFCLKRTPRK